MLFKKNIKLGKIKLKFSLLIFIALIFFISETKSNINLEGQNIDLKILDKISSKNELIKLNNNQEYIYKDLSIKNPVPKLS